MRERTTRALPALFVACLFFLDPRSSLQSSALCLSNGERCRHQSRLSLHAKKGPERPDVRSLLEAAGLLPPKPTEKWLSEDEAIEFETPLDRLKQNIEDSLIKPNQEALVPEGEEIEFETPLSRLGKGVWQVEDEIGTPLDWIKQSLPQEQLVPRGEEVQFETPLSFLFKEDEELESEEMWSDLIQPLLKTDSMFDPLEFSPPAIAKPNA
mmetsp:Transcript_18280/g.21268  ORF Transcript_18280/g.21268 Transcript_18280/m.21268 type:complete len:210 (+) Transcript_18280:1-630(+)